MLALRCSISETKRVCGFGGAGRTWTAAARSTCVASPSFLPPVVCSLRKASRNRFVPASENRTAASIKTKERITTTESKKCGTANLHLRGVVRMRLLRRARGRTRGHHCPAVTFRQCIASGIYMPTAHTGRPSSRLPHCAADFVVSVFHDRVLRPVVYTRRTLAVPTRGRTYVASASLSFSFFFFHR